MAPAFGLNVYTKYLHGAIWRFQVTFACLEFEVSFWVWGLNLGFFVRLRIWGLDSDLGVYRLELRGARIIDT